MRTSPDRRKDFGETSDNHRENCGENDDNRREGARGSVTRPLEGCL
jgi:hypothetical protein